MTLMANGTRVRHVAVALMACLLCLTCGRASALPQDRPPTFVAVTGIRIIIPQTVPAPEQAERWLNFKLAVGQIKSCADISSAARKVGALVIPNQRLALTALPQKLRDDIAQNPIGTPSSIYGDGGEFNVLVRCG